MTPTAHDIALATQATEQAATRMGLKRGLVVRKCGATPTKEARYSLINPTTNVAVLSMTTLARIISHLNSLKQRRAPPPPEEG